MGQLPDGSARTVAAVRRALEQSQASLAKHDAFTPKTVAKRKKRTRVHDAPMSPRYLCSRWATSLSTSRRSARRKARFTYCVATDHACTSADAERHGQANKIVAAQFLRHVVAAIPAKIHTVGARRGIVETVGAFANAQGGTVLVT